MSNRDIRSFGYWGAKNAHLEWLLPLLPYRDKYLEPFYGSGAIHLNRRRSKEEHVNDKEMAVVSFFEAVRDHKEELIERLEWTPRASDEYDKCWPVTEDDDVVERARKFYVRVVQGRNGSFAETTSWRAGRGDSRAAPWLDTNWKMRFERIRDRIREVHIHNRGAVGLIKLRDTRDMVIYCDPPYPHESRVSDDDYANEMSEDDHVELADTLKACEAFVALSGYRCDLYDELYKGWHRHDRQVHAAAGRGVAKRVESLWTNEPPPMILPGFSLE